MNYVLPCAMAIYEFIVIPLVHCSVFKKQVELILMRGLHICKSACSIKCICKPQINIHSAFMVMCEHVQSSEKPELSSHTFTAEGGPTK